MGKRGEPVLVDDERSATRRLSNIRPHEVSLVDTAANGRQFLIVKRKGDDMKPKDKSLFANVVKTRKPAAEEADGNAAGGTPDPAAAAAPAATEVVAEPTMIQKFVDIFKGIKATAEEKKIDISKSVADEQFMMFTAMADALDWLTDTVKMISGDLKTFVESGGSTGFMGEPVVKSLGGAEAAKMVLEEGMTDEMFEKLLVLVNKKGAKMKGARLEKFRGLVSGLQELLKDLDVSQEAVVDKGAAAPAAEPVPAAAPAGLSAEDVKALAATEIKKALDGQKADHDKVVKSLTDRLAKVEAAPVAPSGEGSNTTEEPAVTTTNKNNQKKSIFAGVL